MSTRFSIICVVFVWFALFSANTAAACGSGKSDTATEKNCCKPEKEASAPAHQCSGDDGCKERHPGKPCSDPDGCGGCHCPCGMVLTPVPGSALVNAPSLPPMPSVHEDMLRQEFYFAQHLPEDVYLPIWQPPQLAA